MELLSLPITNLQKVFPYESPMIVRAPLNAYTINTNLTCQLSTSLLYKEVSGTYVSLTAYEVPYSASAILIQAFSRFRGG